MLNKQTEEKKQIYIETDEKGLKVIKNLMKVIEKLTGEKGKIVKIEKLKET